MKLVLATNNEDKITEIRACLADLELEIMTRADFENFPDPPETANTLEGNAELKARAISDSTSLPALADDTGLEVAALNGAPGVFSARYSGEDATYESNCAKLLREMEGLPEDKRGARFRTVIAIVWDRDLKLVDGVVDGRITESPRGASGFGYDPVFLYPPAGKTFAEMTLEEKNEISHRGKALAQARGVLEKLLKSSF
ncbi:MAG: RdgB/HAM1 family non-canonical purine NTP pyrophosphatase [candidate division Zixibacteria bacterium]|nr:RdgB/HAM1 family non-canonical purine NTP pyrophosphatase [candidate division Zixibacteria bacterium]